MFSIILSELEHATQILPEQVNEAHTSHRGAVSPCSDKGFNVLIVDDDADILECYTMLFELEGYHTEAALTPFEAMEKVKTSRFDLAILDFKLPNMRGDELALRLLEVNSAMKLVFISGHNDAKEILINRGLNVSYFMKPVDPESLLGAARTAFNSGNVLTALHGATAIS